MKTFLLATLAVLATQFAAHAADTITGSLDELVPADQLAAMDGLNLDNEATFEDDLRPPPPPFHPVPPPPHPYPHPHPYPPYPYPVPPPQSWYECAAQDQWGNVFTGRGNNPVFLQRDVHNRCEVQSGAYCNDLGCHRV